MNEIKHSDTNPPAWELTMRRIVVGLAASAAVPLTRSIYEIISGESTP